MPPLLVTTENIPVNVSSAINSIIRKEGYTDYNVKTEIISNDGTSFLGTKYTVTITGKRKEEEKETYLFFKHIFKSENLVTLMDLPLAYEHEAFFYNKLSKIYKELEEDANVPENKRLNIIQSYDETDSEITVLENFAVKGYAPFQKTHVMTLNEAKLALEQIAKFHALSFVLEKKRPEYFQRIKKIRAPFLFDGDWLNIAQTTAEIAIKYIPEKSKKKLEKCMPTLKEKWVNYFNSKDVTRCLCHGDFRLNNLLLKYKENEVNDLIMLDYQLINYSSPINDFLFFIAIGTDQKFRIKYLDYLKDYYYEHFSNYFKYFGMNSEDIYGKADFDKDFKERLDYGLIAALYFMPFFLAADDDVPDLEKSLTELEIKVHKVFPERIQGIVDDYESWGYI